MGVVNLLSALLSHPPERLHALLRLVPTVVLDTSRTFTLLAGVLLLLTAWGLRRGKRRAFVAALFLCALSVPVNLLKAFDFEEATFAAGVLFVLGLLGDAFTVKSREISLRAIRSRTLWAALALVAVAVLGCLWVRIEVAGDASFRRAGAEALYRLFGIGEPTVLIEGGSVVRHHRMVRWFLGSLPLTSLTIVVLAGLSALRPVAHRGRHRAEVERTRALLREHGASSVSAFALAPDADYFFSENRRAVIAYRFESDTLLAIGDPIGPAEEVPPLLRAFELFCREHDWQFAFFQARPELLPAYREMGFRALHIGEDPVLHAERFSLDGSAIGEVRRAVNKLRGAGLAARMFLPGRSGFDPARDPDGLYEQMRAISSAWLRTRPGGEKGFCMGRFDAATLRESWVAVAWDPARRRVEAFLTWVPVWGRRGWALDLMRRRSDAVPGVMEYLVAVSVEEARGRGDEVLSLSLSALARAGDGAAGEPPAAEPAGTESAACPRGEIESDRTRAFLMEHLARFYDFQNLFRWKAKFQPEFEARYLVYPGPLALPRIALALVRAQSPGGLISYLRRAR